MARYVQTFPKSAQDMLDSCAVQPMLGDGCLWNAATNVPPRHGIQPLWTSSLTESSPIAGPDEDVPRIRGKDMGVFAHVWLMRKFPAVSDITQHFVGYYRTFCLCLSAELPRPDAILSTGDIDQILALCLSRGVNRDEVPTCTGEMVRDDQKLQWKVLPVPRPKLEAMILRSKSTIERASARELAKQYSMLGAFNGLFRSTRRRLPPEIRGQNARYNNLVRARLRQHGIDMRRVRATPAHQFVVGEYAQYGLQKLLKLFKESCALSVALNCPLYSLPGESRLLE